MAMAFTKQSAKKLAKTQGMMGSVQDSCILPVITYSINAMAFTRKGARKLATQNAMEKAMLGIRLTVKIRSNDIIQRKNGINHSISG